MIDMAKLQAASTQKLLCFGTVRHVQNARSILLVRTDKLRFVFNSEPMEFSVALPDDSIQTIPVRMMHSVGVNWNVLLAEDLRANPRPVAPWVVRAAATLSASDFKIDLTDPVALVTATPILPPVPLPGVGPMMVVAQTEPPG